MSRRLPGRGVAAALAIAGAAAAFIAVVAAATRARDIAFFAVAGDPVIVTDAPLYAVRSPTPGCSSGGPARARAP